MNNEADVLCVCFMNIMIFNCSITKFIFNVLIKSKTMIYNNN